MPEEFPFKGVWIPAKVFKDARLTQSDKFLWSIVHILSNAKGCFATRETLARYLDMSERNVQYGIGRLVESGRNIRNVVAREDILLMLGDVGAKPLTTEVT